MDDLWKLALSEEKDPAIPELCVQTPASNSAADKHSRLYDAPLNLNAPPFWRFSVQISMEKKSNLLRGSFDLMVLFIKPQTQIAHAKMLGGSI